MDYHWDQLLSEAEDVASCYVMGYGAYQVMADHLIDGVIDAAAFVSQVYELRAAVGARTEHLDRRSVDQLQDVIKEQLDQLDRPDSPSRTVLFVSDENGPDQAFESDPEIKP